MLDASPAGTVEREHGVGDKMALLRDAARPPRTRTPTSLALPLLLAGVLAAPLACRARTPVDTARAERRLVTSPSDAPDLDPAADVVRVRLRAAELPGPDGLLRYGYEGQSPGPTIRAKIGDTVVVELQNALPFATTIHWHGVSVPFDMDGVTWMRAPVMAGGSFTYTFTVQRAGTFWYHPHFDTEQQVDLGLYGAFVVEDRADPTPDAELVLVIDDASERRMGEHAPAHGHARLIPRWLVNGVPDAVYSAQGGSVIRARIINASNAGYLALHWPDLRIIGTDQGLLPALDTPSRIILSPGDRADVEWRIGRDPFDVIADAYSLNGGDSTASEPVTVLRVEVEAPATPPAGLAWPFPGGDVTPDPGYADIVYAFAGSDRTETWMINGEQFPNVTIQTLAFGQTGIIEVRNLSPSEHPFHLHGLPFEVVSINGVAPATRIYEDTINVRIRDRMRLRVVADNLGDWMAHCHILPHAGDGMMTVLRVE